MHFEVADAPLIADNDGIDVGVADTVDELIDLLLDAAKLLFEAFRARLHGRGLGVPLVAEHVEGDIEQPLGGFQVGEQRFELALDLLPANGLAMLGTASGVTEIVWIFRAAPLRPASGHGLAAAAAGDEAAQREVFVQVLTRGGLGHARAALLNLLVGFQRNQRLVLAFDEGQIPILDRDVASINLTGEDFRDALLMNLAALVLRIGGLRFQKALHLRLRLEAARGITFEGFGDDGRQRFVAHQQLAVTFDLFEAIADRRLEHPIAVHGAGLHLLDDLTPVLVALKLALRGNDRLHELAFGRVLEPEVQALDARTAHPERLTKLDMELGIAGEAFEVIEDDDIPLAAVGLGIEMIQEIDHSGALHEVAPARNVIVKHRFDLRAHTLRMVAAAGFLRIEAVTFNGLLGARHTAIDKGE